VRLLAGGAVRQIDVGEVNGRVFLCNSVLGFPSRLAVRREGLRVDFDTRGGSLGSQMKRADKSGARFTLVMGEAERTSGQAKLKPMAGGEPIPVALADVARAVRASSPGGQAGGMGSP